MSQKNINKNLFKKLMYFFKKIVRDILIFKYIFIYILFQKIYILFLKNLIIIYCFYKKNYT